MGKASKKVWDTDITYSSNIFAYLTVWLNPIRIEAKLGRYTHPPAAGWVLCMWDTMMPRALNEFIKQEDVRSKLEWQIKENATLNKVHKFLAGANIDENLQKLICVNHNFYRFMCSTCVNIIYMNTEEVKIQERSFEGYSNLQATPQVGWISQPMNNNYVPQYPPLPLNTAVKQKQINKDPLSEDEKKEISTRTGKARTENRRDERFEKITKTCRRII